MLGKYCREIGDYIFGDFSLRLVNFGIQTWMMNLCSLIFALGSLYFTSEHHIGIALIFFFITYVFHYMDGNINNARRFYGKHSMRYHRLLYISSDVLSETIFFSGLALAKYVSWRYSIIVITTYIVFTILGILVYNKRVFDLEESYFDQSDRFIIVVIFLVFKTNKTKSIMLCLIIISLINFIGIIQRLVALIITKQPKLI
jgi:hypothetical protein